VGADTALVQRGVVACNATSLKDTSADVKAQGRAAEVRAGALEPFDFAGRGLSDDSTKRQSLRFAMSFDSPGQAARQLRTRLMLVTGPFIGREGRLEDSLTLTGSSTAGSTATLRFDHPTESIDYMTGEGPLLFAGCPG
ncbi:MAG: hypothetical protein JWQ70_2046, partial [Aeromicrobium sp.]|nr:hypothetical protein [Aeromicrobium sp.]